jgi:hypothetical protein
MQGVGDCAGFGQGHALASFCGADLTEASMPTRGVILLCTACNMTLDNFSQRPQHNMVAKP